VSPFKVLIADDNADLGWLLAGILRRAGATVDVCQDPDVAIANSDQTDYSAILVEPSPSAGFQPLLDHLAANRTDGLDSVVVATTESDPAFRAELARSGVFRILKKPLTPAVVREAMLACAAHHDE
jgi:DNA-binding response OmpR family regulator